MFASTLFQRSVLLITWKVNWLHNSSFTAPPATVRGRTLTHMGQPDHCTCGVGDVIEHVDDLLKNTDESVETEN